ncbi:MAG: hypothetical protein PHC53_05885 [Patescibacteria group bacterium]|nr:hypothetical protein [Patescibacteria group bacterium]
MEMKFNPFEIKATAEQLRTEYHRVMKSDQVKEKAQTSAFFNDPRIAKGFQERGQEKAVQAAKLIIGQVGKANLEDLRAAVQPEELKDVLLRGGAGVDVLMMAGEKEAVGLIIDERHKQMQRVRDTVEEFKASQAYQILLKIWQKVIDAEAKLLALEVKDIWTASDAGHYFAYEKKFAEELTNARATCERYKEMAA